MNVKNLYEVLDLLMKEGFEDTNIVISDRHDTLWNTYGTRLHDKQLLIGLDGVLNDED